VRRQSEATTAQCPTNFSLSLQVELLCEHDKLKFVGQHSKLTSLLAFASLSSFPIPTEILDRRKAIKSNDS
jgi:hypothetical protein